MPGRFTVTSSSRSRDRRRGR